MSYKNSEEARTAQSVIQARADQSVSMATEAAVVEPTALTRACEAVYGLAKKASADGDPFLGVMLVAIAQAGSLSISASVIELRDRLGAWDEVKP